MKDLDRDDSTDGCSGATATFNMPVVTELPPEYQELGSDPG